MAGSPAMVMPTRPISRVARSPRAWSSVNSSRPSSTSMGDCERAPAAVTRAIGPERGDGGATTDLWHCPSAGCPTTIEALGATRRPRKEAEMTDRIDVIELLLQDHRMISGLAEELDRTDDPAEISRLYLRIVDELFAHEAAE